MTAQELAQKLLDFYQNDPKRWTQGAFSRNSRGEKIYSYEPDVVSWCALGALSALNLGDHADALSQKLLPKSLSLGTFNDGCKDFDEFRTKLEKVAAGS